MHRYHKHALAAVSAMLFIAISASCSSGNDNSSDTRVSRSQDAASQDIAIDSPTPEATPSPTETYRLDDTTPDLSLDDAAKNEALSTAIAAWRAFARPDLDFDTWWAELEPMLTQRSAENYFYTDPANVVALAVSDTAQIVDAPSGYEIHVEVSTDRGGRTVVLLRSSEAGSWRVDRFVLPEEEG